MSNEPIQKFKEGQFEFAVWKKEDGSLSFSIQKSWKKDTDKEWQQRKFPVYPQQFEQFVKVVTDMNVWLKNQ